MDQFPLTARGTRAPIICLAGQRLVHADWTPLMLDPIAGIHEMKSKPTGAMVGPLHAGIVASKRRRLSQLPHEKLQSVCFGP